MQVPLDADAVTGRSINRGAGQIQVSLLSEMTFHAIRHDIVSGQLEPGKWLRQEELAQQFGVSQATVREALKRLVAEGLAIHVPHKGVKVITLSLEDLRDNYDIRALLEGLANEAAADLITPQDLARMRELLPDTIVTADSESTQVAREANREFHWIAIYASKRRHLIKLLEQLWVLIDPYLVYGRFWNTVITKQERMKGSALDLEDHKQLLEALESKNGVRARRVTRRYVNRSFRELESQIRVLATKVQNSARAI